MHKCVCTFVYLRKFELNYLFKKILLYMYPLYKNDEGFYYISLCQRWWFAHCSLCSVFCILTYAHSLFLHSFFSFVFGVNSHRLSVLYWSKQVQLTAYLNYFSNLEYRSTVEYLTPFNFPFLNFSIRIILTTSAFNYVRKN